MDLPKTQSDASSIAQVTKVVTDFDRVPSDLLHATNEKYINAMDGCT